MKRSDLGDLCNKVMEFKTNSVEMGSIVWLDSSDLKKHNFML